MVEDVWIKYIVSPRIVLRMQAQRSRSFGGRYSMSMISNTSRSLFTGSASPAAPGRKKQSKQSQNTKALTFRANALHPS